MADAADTPTTPDAGNDGGTETPKPEGGKDTGLGEAGQKALAAERDARKAAERELRDAKKATAELAAKVKEFEDRGKSDDQKKDERIAELESLVNKHKSELEAQLKAAERSKLAATVAAEKGVPVELLKGDTREALEASADKALEWRNPKGTKIPRPQGIRSGASAPPDGSTPKQQAAAALRLMRTGG
ncbi:head scaffolding protein [Mycobacterium phage DS6A]|uniref:Scaffolding protein n=1 Tax=Mycobacterium phage DS6A TaxID=45764 RepID=G8I4C0_9CAUD|nr:head scaffolding protein [Mycobacterium phage DS6A]AER47564.1 hypothetical protein DS6A_10 [Mycobacterium phage DS6A]